MSEGQEKPGSCKERAFSVALLACTLAFRPPPAVGAQSGDCQSSLSKAVQRLPVRHSRQASGSAARGMQGAEQRDAPLRSWTLPSSGLSLPSRSPGATSCKGPHSAVLILDGHTPR